MSLVHQFTRFAGACLLLTLIAVHAAPAQGSGTIKGTVRDRSTKEILPGATIVVRGTSIGAASNADGAFVVRSAPAGNQTITVSYVGYVPASVPVTVTEGGTVTSDVSLTPTVIEGAEVVITAQGVGQLQAINQQLTSNKIVNVVSESKIQELPDFNAAQAISRLPGISALQSSGEANKVVIRGLAPQYNQVSVSGITLSSTGNTKIGVTGNTDILSGSVNQDRSVDLTMVTPYMLKTISVYKSLTPDMNANAVGGIVNMELREAPEGLHTDLLWQSGYVDKNQTLGNYRFVASGSDRFLENRLGLYVLGNLENYDRNSDNMSGTYALRSLYPDSTGYAPVYVQNVSLNRHIETRQRYGGNVVLDYRLPFGTLRSVNMFSRLNSEYRDYNTQIDYQNHNLNFNVRSGDRNLDLAINTLEGAFDFGFLAANLTVANNYSRNDDPGSPYFTFRESGGTIGSTPDNTTPENLTNLINHVGPQNVYLNTVNLLSADYKENDQVAKADFKIPLSVGSAVSGSIKVGGEYRYNLRKNDQSAPYARIDGTSTISQEMVDSIRSVFGLEPDSGANSRFPGTGFSSYDEDLLASFLDDRFGGVQWMPETGILEDILAYIPTVPSLNWENSSGVNAGGWFDGEYQYLANDYKYIEKDYAAFIMSDLNIGPDINVVGGVRFEQDRSAFTAFNSKEGRDPGSQVTIPVAAYPQHHYWLPMVQGRYKPVEWADIRYAYTQTLARPDYHQLTPHFSMDYSRFNVYAGNPKLNPGRAFNHDLMLTVHDNDLGLVSLGGFVKDIYSFTYYTQYRLYATAPPGIESLGTFEVGGVLPQAGAQVYTYVNSRYKAKVRGLEFDFQTRFWYLPVPFNGMVFGLNYTHIWSKATYPWRDSRTSLNPNPPPRFLTEVFDSTRSGRLINQPDDLLNAYVGYDFKDFSGRISFLFQGNSVSYIGNFPEQDGFTQDYFRIDASARQKLPWAGLQLFVDVTNLNARKNSSAQKSIGGFTSELHYGLVANFGIRFIM